MLSRRAANAETGGETVFRAECAFDGWCFNVVQRTLRRPDGRLFRLTNADFQLLRILVERPRQPLSREALLHLCGRGSDDVMLRAVDVQVSRLRRKLADGDPTARKLIHTLRGGGYVFLPTVRFDP